MARARSQSPPKAPPHGWSHGTVASLAIVPRGKRLRLGPTDSASVAALGEPGFVPGGALEGAGVAAVYA
jgi:hypothetical protein